MTDEELGKTRSWFTRFVHSYASPNGELDPMLELKEHHSERVAEQARQLAEELGWSRSKSNTMEALGLLHDIGRFPQFAEHGTYSDAASVDHGERGWAVAEQEPLLLELPTTERGQLLDGIRNHNARTIPDDLPSESLALLEVLRDADKLDVFHVVLEAVSRDGFRDLPEMLPQITLDRSSSPEVIAEVRDRRSCSLEKLRTLGDFLLMQLSWVFDINTLPALRCLDERGVVSRILAELPEGPSISGLGDLVEGYMAERLGRDPP